MPDWDALKDSLYKRMRDGLKKIPEGVRTHPEVEKFLEETAELGGKMLWRSQTAPDDIAKARAVEYLERLHNQVEVKVDALAIAAETAAKDLISSVVGTVTGFVKDLAGGLLKGLLP